MAGKKRTKGILKNFEAAAEGLKRKGRYCPKCGAGVLMAKHSNRHYCGKCHYAEYA